MDKDAYYFSHDSNARFDTKILKLRAKYGLEGYGFYFCILEIMRDNSDYRLQVDDIDVIAFQLQLDINKTHELLDFCINIGLFLQEEGYIYSYSFLERMNEMNEKRKKRQEAGRKGGQSSKTKAMFKQNESNAQAMLKQNESMKGKEKKGKEIKEKEIKKLDPYCSNLKQYFIDEYKKVFNTRPFLSQMNCNKLSELNAEIENFKDYIPGVLQKLKEIDWDIDFKPSASWLLSKDNFISVLNGEHDNKELEEKRLMEEWRKS